MYGTIPVVAALARRKVPDDWLTSFMMCSILLNPQLLIYTLALGVPITVMRFVVCFLAGIISGILVRFCFHGKSFYTFLDFEKSENRDTDHNPIVRLLKNMGRAIKITVPYFLAGTLLTALYQTFFPSYWVKTIFSWNPGFGVLFSAVLGVSLYACGGGTIPLLGAWLEAGMTRGSAAAFMITGQSIKMTNVSAVKMILSSKHFVLYIAFNILFSIISGFIY
jgi:uncharacterized membrane protein YraQ (UPF0718 family)